MAQELFEGVTIAGEHVGLITYMRTNSFRLQRMRRQPPARPSRSTGRRLPGQAAGLQDKDRQCPGSTRGYSPNQLCTNS